MLPAPAKHDQATMKQANRRIVLDAIRERRPISRTDLAALTGMSAASVGRIVADLIALGLVVETGRTSGGVGRKATLLDLDGRALLAGGVEVERDAVRAGLVELGGRVAAAGERRLAEDERSPGDVARHAAALLRQLCGERGVPALLGVGVALPGVVDADAGRVVFSSSLGWRDVAFARMLEAELALPVALDNDLKAQALGESFARDEDDAGGLTALVSIGRGVGAALIVGRSLYRGAGNLAGEIGHTVVDPAGRRCECGKRGCLQTYVSTAALLREARRIWPDTDLAGLFARQAAGDERAVRLVDRACGYAAMTLNNVVCAYNPRTMILAGEFVERGPGVFEQIVGKLQAYVWEPFAGSYAVVRSRLGGDGTMFGAAQLALRQRLMADALIR